MTADTPVVTAVGEPLEGPYPKLAALAAASLYRENSIETYLVETNAGWWVCRPVDKAAA